MLGFVSIAELAISDLSEGAAPEPVASTLLLERRPVMIIGDNLFRADMGEDFAGTPIPVLLERVGLTIEGQARDGSYRTNPSSVKLLREIWPIFRGEFGTEIAVYAGFQMKPDNDIVWQGPFEFIIGLDSSVKPLIEGAYLSYRFLSIGQPPWDLLQVDMDIEVTGEVYD